MVLPIGASTDHLWCCDSYSIGQYYFGAGPFNYSNKHPRNHASSLPQLMMDSTILCFANCLIRIKIFYRGNTNASASIVGAVVATYLTKTLLELAKNWLSTKKESWNLYYE